MPAFGEHLARYYAGLTPKEERVWRRWLVDYEQAFESFRYNVHVGEGVTPPAGVWTGDPEMDERLRQQYVKATQRKIDCIGFKAGETWVIEVEDRADARALGQLHLYARLLPATMPIDGTLLAACVCRYVGTDMRDAFTDAGFYLFETGQPVV